MGRLEVSAREPTKLAPSRIAQAAATVPRPVHGTLSRVHTVLATLTPDERAEFIALVLVKENDAGWLARVLSDATGQEITPQMLRQQRSAICRG